MASPADVVTGESSAAQKLLQKHAQDPHSVTVEDAEDEDLPVHKHSAPPTTKQPEPQRPKERLDTQSHELFPELGASKGKSANVPPVWGAKTNTNGKTNGSGPSAVSQGPAPAMFIPGRNVESITLEPQDIMPRGQLRRPIADIIKDINRKSRANISMGGASNGRLKFDATGPQDVAQQALKDLVSQIGTRVRWSCPQNLQVPILIGVDFHQGTDSFVIPSPYHRTRRLHDQESPGKDRCQNPTSKDGGNPSSGRRR